MILLQTLFILTLHFKNSTISFVSFLAISFANNLDTYWSYQVFVRMVLKWGCEKVGINESWTYELNFLVPFIDSCPFLWNHIKGGQGQTDIK